ncbi:MAG: TIGR02594 family protein [Acidobacteria bacterium]|nr:TIGR02594 family protein [Acidobacteriota bacterium]
MSENKYKVTANSLNVREAPTINASVIGNLNKGDVVDYISTSGDGYWIKIQKNGLQGWASHKYLSLITTVSDPPTAEKFPWMPIALAEVGVKEFPGSGDNPRIVQYLKSTNLGAPSSSQDETPWCSAFANWCVEQSGYEGTDSAWARSWLNWGKKTTTPERGCIVVFSRDGGGHVAFYIGETADHIEVLGGNQSNEVKISMYPKSRLLGYRIPG